MPCPSTGHPPLEGSAGLGLLVELGRGGTEAVVSGYGWWGAGEEMGLHSYARVPRAWLEESQHLALREGAGGGGDPL